MSSIEINEWHSIHWKILGNKGPLQSVKQYTTSDNITELRPQSRFQTCFSEILVQVPHIIFKVQK